MFWFLINFYPSWHYKGEKATTALQKHIISVSIDIFRVFSHQFLLYIKRKYRNAHGFSTLSGEGMFAMVTKKECFQRLESTSCYLKAKK